MRYVNSPLRYPGGKQKALKFLIQFFPEFNELREPMCGGASVTLYWAQKKLNAKFLMGDINYDLYCFWKSTKEHLEEMIKIIYELKSTYKNGKELYQYLIQKKETNISEIERGAYFFVLNRITFSGTTESGGYSESAFQKRFTLSSIERLSLVSHILQRVEIYNFDYEYLMNLPGDNVLIFLDPPYYSATSSKLYGKNGKLHTEFDHLRFFEVVSKSKHKVLITYDDSEFIRKLYKDFYKIPWNLKYGMTNYGKDYLRTGNELLIANFPIFEKAMKFSFIQQC